jgi:phosphoglycerol transferase MdoB-like AlkP superfamily enzyme
MRLLPPSIQFVALGVLVSLALFTLLRIAFWWTFRDGAGDLGGGELLHAFYLGLKFDLRLSLLLGLPALLLCWIPPLHAVRSRWGRGLWTGYWLLALLGVLLVYAIDFGHYAYLRSRMDSTLVRFLYDPRDSARMVWESYPVLWGALLLAATLAVLALALRRGIARIARSPASQRSRRSTAFAIAAFVLLYALGIYGKLSYYPLRWSDAFFSTQSFSSALALNPVLYTYDTFKNREVDFDVEATRDAYERVAAYLGVDDPDPERLDYVRIQQGQEAAGRPNVVIVLLESFAYYKTGISGNPLDPSPNFDALARRGILFRRFYSSHWGTARGVFASLTGLPDVELHRTSSRNPLIVRQHTLVNAFEGYEKFYFIGGSATWGNIRGLLSHNIPGLHLYEEGSYDATRVDVWGISDLHLFEAANRALRDVRDKPFFAIIQTAGYHEPYSIPDDNRGFEAASPSEEEVREYGFTSLDDFNSFRFMDHSLGFFMEAAARESYFEDTIFVFYGDHGLPRRAAHRPPGEERIGLNSFHVPLVIYAPERLEPRVIDEVSAQVDALPTVLGLTSLAAVNSTFGRDLLDEPFGKSRYAFTILHGNRRISIISDEFCFQVDMDGTDAELNQIFSDDPGKDVKERYPELAAELEEIALAFYETLKYMRYHNSPETIAAQLDSGLGGRSASGSSGTTAEPARQARQR